ncbi:glycosyltransferase [Flavobacterium sedimenticola]|uniref:Glycosyltransferase n=1 Tax=Flavobacterium sedimenticola TaxID=3043286 RepID=A0ABT6XRK0_9FLAO|nr:glycosyltransferase [Flavobacterium sedimenticola]MDI9257705.1 glycosyltransferase [Flavobacterium sedimenticola]
MNILFVANFPIEDNKGGVQRVTATLAEAFRALEIHVFYLSLSSGQTQTIQGVTQFFLPDGSDLQREVNQHYYATLLRENAIDVIINQAGIYGHVMSFVSRNLPKGIRLFTVHHNCIRCLQENYKNIVKGGVFGKIAHRLDYAWFWKILLWKHKRKYGTYFRNAIAQSDALVLLSESFIPELKTYLSSWPENKVAAIYNPAPFKVHPEALYGKENRLLYVGRVEYTQKQCNLLLPLWKAIHQRFPDWHFDIVGGGSKLKELMALATEDTLEHLHFHGFTDPKPFLEKAKVLVMTSSFEGYGMVLVEAQAYGVVPIAFHSFSSVSSIIEDDKNGVLVHPFDLESYIEKLAALLENETKRFPMAQYGQQTVTRFMPDIIAQEWLHLIHSKT